MTEDFALQSLRYLHNQMASSERRAFDQLLDSDAAACALFKSYADALAAHATQEATSAETISESDAALILGRLQYETLPELGTGRSNNKSSRTWFWPIAATLLLALNLWQFLRPDQPGSSLPHDGIAPETHHGSESALFSSGISAGGMETESKTQGSKSMGLERLQEERSRLNEECALLRDERDRLTSDAQRLAHSLRTLTLAHASGTKLSAMEMVDPGNYANGQRRGLFDSARKLLVSQGSVTPPTPSGPISGTDISSGTASSSSSGVLVDSNGSTLGITIPGATIIGAPPSTADTNTPGSTVQGPLQSQGSIDRNTASDSTNVLLGSVNSTSASDTTSTNIPYAWTIFDASSNQGSINLYNLPSLSSKETLVLWTKSDDPGSGFVRIGSIPEALAGKAGNILFRTPDSSNPAEILISRESKETPSATPTGPIVLHGP